MRYCGEPRTSCPITSATCCCRRPTAATSAHRSSRPQRGRTFVGDRDYFRRHSGGPAKRRHRQSGTRPHHRQLGDIGRTRRSRARTGGSRPCSASASRSSIFRSAQGARSSARQHRPDHQRETGPSSCATMTVRDWVGRSPGRERSHRACARPRRKPAAPCSGRTRSNASPDRRPWPPFHGWCRSAYPPNTSLSNVVTRLAWGTAASLSCAAGRARIGIGVLGTDHQPIAAAQRGRIGAGGRQAHPPHRRRHAGRGRRARQYVQRHGGIARGATPRARSGARGGLGRGDRARAAGADGAAGQGNARRRHRCLAGRDRLLRSRPAHRALEPRRRADVRLYRRGECWARRHGWCRPRPTAAIAGPVRALSHRRGDPRRGGQAQAQGRSTVDIRLAATPMYNPDGKVLGRGVGLRGHHRPQEGRAATEPDRAL